MTSLRLSQEQKLSSTQSSLSDDIISNNSINPTSLDSTNTLNSNSGDVLKQMGFNPLPNVLNDYDGVVYNFQFSIINPYIPSKKIILAESGSTTIDIISVEGTESLQPNFRTKNTTWSSFDMVLFEPMGSNLLDMIANAAIELDVPNVSKTLFNLKLTFKGYNPVTGAPLVIGNSWNWPVIILNLNTTINESGSTYRVELLRATDIPSTNNFITIPQSYQFKGKTLGECLNDLIGKINSQIQETYSCPFIKYKIKDIPYPNSADADVSSPLQLVVKNPNSVLESSRNPDGGHVASGTNLSDLITSLVSNSDTAAKLSSTARTTTNEPTDNASKKPSVFMIVVMTDVQFGDYQEAFGDYEKILTYTLIPYETYKTISNIKSSQDIQESSYCSKKVSAMISNKVLNKDYEYIFTGENTEILDINLQSNFNYAVIQDYLQGFVHDTVVSSGQINNQSNLQNNLNNIHKQYLYLQSQKVEAMTILQSTTNELNRATSSSSITGNITSSTNQGNTSSITSTLSQLRNAQNNAQARVDSISTQMDKLTKENPNLTSNYSSNQRLSIQQKLASNPDIQYADNYNPEQAQKSYSNLFSIGVRADISNNTNTTNYNLDSSYDNRRSMYSAMMDQMYELSGDALQTIEMTIRGDPYWLGATFMNDNYSINSVDFSTEITNSNCNYYQPTIMFNDLSFVLRYNTPNGFDSDGRPILKRNDYFSGFFGVVTVNHIWSNGQYLQKLTAYRIPGLMLSNIIKSTN